MATPNYSISQAPWLLNGGMGSIYAAGLERMQQRGREAQKQNFNEGVASQELRMEQQQWQQKQQQYQAQAQAMAQQKAKDDELSQTIQGLQALQLSGKMTADQAKSAAIMASMKHGGPGTAGLAARLPGNPPAPVAPQPIVRLPLGQPMPGMPPVPQSGPSTFPGMAVGPPGQYEPKTGMFKALPPPAKPLSVPEGSTWVPPDKDTGMPGHFKVPRKPIKAAAEGTMTQQDRAKLIDLRKRREGVMKIMDSTGYAVEEGGMKKADAAKYEKQLADIDAQIDALEGGGNPTASAPAAAEASNPNEVIRQTKDGKKAVFDAKTKAFIRYAQ